MASWCWNSRAVRRVSSSGRRPEKWAHKILHPPTRAGKLGIKAGLTVRVVGEFAPDFLEELREVQVVSGRSKADLVFFAAADRAALAQVPKLAAMLKPAGALWVVYPKGVAGDPRDRK